MTDLVNTKFQDQNQVSLTTVEIANQTGKLHKNVLRDTRDMLIELYGENGRLNFELTYKDAQGKERPCYRLPKKEVIVLVSGYSIKLRMKIVTRLEELETERQGNVFSLPDWGDDFVRVKRGGNLHILVMMPHCQTLTKNSN